MAGRGRAPKDPAQRRNRAVPIRGEISATPGIGWQHGAIPAPPDGLLAPSRVAWETWMRAWFAAHWSPDDLPGLRKVVQLYDATERGELHRSAELRMSMDNYGITPKGQQDRRWQRPKPEDVVPVPDVPSTGKYARLRSVG
jgi:hypothetical protein